MAMVNCFPFSSGSSLTDSHPLSLPLSHTPHFFPFLAFLGGSGAAGSGVNPSEAMSSLHLVFDTAVAYKRGEVQADG